MSGEEERDEAIERVEAAAHAEWIRVARRCVRWLAEERDSLTADDIWESMERWYPTLWTPENRAMGAVMTWARRVGIIEPTLSFKPTDRAEAHRRPVRVWRSLLHG